MASVWGFDKWLGDDVVIIGPRALGFLFRCCHLSVSVLTLGFFNAGTRMFDCWCLTGSVVVLDCFSAGALAQEGRANFALECLSAGTLALECRKVWRSPCLELGGQCVLGVIIWLFARLSA